MKEGKADLLEARGYLKDAHDLSFDDKLYRLKDQAGKNLRVQTNTVHISLNFDPDERPDSHTLVSIADAYMKGIGFEDQPYLVYRHTDAGHPHIHIVSTNIEPDGRRISLHNLGKNQSEQARQDIEDRFSLVKAGSKNKDLKPEKIDLVPVQYGKLTSKRAVTNVVSEVVRTYKFTSLPELNAVLNQFNVMADRGGKASVMFARKGLHYYILGSRGEKICVPIKASAIYGKPTLSRLEKNFVLNEVLRRPFRDRLREKIDRSAPGCGSIAGLQKQLRALGVQAVVRSNDDGRVYGVTFVDHEFKAVFNGSDLGKQYSAAGIISRLQAEPRVEGQRENVSGVPGKNTLSWPGFTESGQGPAGNLLLELLLRQENQQTGVPQEFLQKKKRKKRKRLNL
nr:relaxase/mobilization nuclease domain-containing protein [Mucilaginibacter kameinonensis]